MKVITVLHVAELLNPFLTHLPASKKVQHTYSHFFRYHFAFEKFCILLNYLYNGVYNSCNVIFLSYQGESHNCQTIYNCSCFLETNIY